MPREPQGHQDQVRRRHQYRRDLDAVHEVRVQGIAGSTVSVGDPQRRGDAAAEDGEHDQEEPPLTHRRRP